MTDTTTTEPRATDLAITTDPATWTITSSGNNWIATDTDGKTVAKQKTRRALNVNIAEWQIQWDAFHPAIIDRDPDTETTTTETTTEDVAIVPFPTDEEIMLACGMFATIVPVAPVPEEETRITTLDEQRAELLAMANDPTEIVVNAKAINQARKGETAAQADARLKAYRLAKKYKHSLAWQLAMVAEIPDGMTVAELRACINAGIANNVAVDGAQLSRVPVSVPETTTEEIPAPVVPPAIVAPVVPVVLTDREEIAAD